MPTKFPSVRWSYARDWPTPTFLLLPPTSNMKRFSLTWSSLICLTILLVFTLGPLPQTEERYLVSARPTTNINPLVFENFFWVRVDSFLCSFDFYHTLEVPSFSVWGIHSDAIFIDYLHRRRLKALIWRLLLFLPAVWLFLFHRKTSSQSSSRENSSSKTLSYASASHSPWTVIFYQILFFLP